MKKILLLAIFGFSISATAQNMYKPSAYEIQRLPRWAQVMYSDKPNFFEVDSLYRDYFSKNTFEKTYHTQYYKRWKRSVLPYVNDMGYIIPPTSQEEKTIQQEYLSKKPQTTAVSNWSVLGPIQVIQNNGVPGNGQSNIYSVDQCESDPAVMYCGTEPGEVYKSLDGGETWSSVSMSMNFGSGVTAVEVDPTDPDIVFAGGNAGVFKSTDGGSYWTNVLNNSNFGVNEIIINPVNTNIVMAATDKGLFRSTDGGSNWLQLFNQKSYDIKWNALDVSIAYLVKNNPSLVICEFYLSTDSGATWTLQSNGWFSSVDPARNDGGARIGVTTADPNRVYAYLIGEAKANDYGFIGVYRSDDGGYTWSLPNGPAGGPYTGTHPNLAYGNTGWTYHQGFYNCALMVDDTDPNRILIGGLNLWRSNDGGATFTSVAGYVGGPLSLHVDMQDFRLVNGVAWISTDGGIYKSDDFYNSQPTFKMAGVHAADYWGFGSGWNEDVLVGGLYHNGNIAYHENYGSGNYLDLGGGEAPTGYVNPGYNRKTYYSDIGGKLLPNTITGQIGNFSFGKSPNESYYAAESSELEFHPNCYNTAWLGNENKLWRTDDGGGSFNLVNTFGTNVNNQIKYIEVSSSNPDVIYLNQQPASGSVGTLWKTIDGGQTWSTVTIPSGNSRRMVLAIDPNDENRIWIAYSGGSNGNKVYRSTNGGQNWTNITVPLLNNEQVQSLVHVAGTSGGLYYCTNKSVYYYSETSSSWAVANTGLPTFTSTTIARPFYRDGKIRIATYGKGIWESPFEENPTGPIARIQVDKLSQTVICETDSFYFDDHSFLNHSGATWDWTFQNGSPSTSTQRNPVVYFNTTGSHMVTLTVTDGNGQSDTDTIFIELNQFVMPTIISEGFEGSFMPAGWSQFNEDNGGQWALATNAGATGTLKSALFDNFNIDSQSSYDDLRTHLNTTGMQNPVLTFDVAYARWGGQYSDTLEVLVSTDCGQTFNSLYLKGGNGLATSPNNQNFFVPTTSQWRTDTVSLAGYENIPLLTVAFRNIGHWGNCIYVDNVNIGNSPSAVQDFSGLDAPYIYPNPLKSGSCLNIELPEGTFNLKIYDEQGKVLSTKNTVAGSTTFDIPTNTSAGTYIVNIAGEKHIWNKKVVVR
ncbi:MAG: VPS10 domain-containing protein [Bacteroidota bacterium]